MAVRLTRRDRDYSHSPRYPSYEEVTMDGQVRKRLLIALVVAAGPFVRRRFRERRRRRRTQEENARRAGYSPLRPPPPSFPLRATMPTVMEMGEADVSSSSPAGLFFF